MREHPSQHRNVRELYETRQHIDKRDAIYLVEGRVVTESVAMASGKSGFLEVRFIEFFNVLLSFKLA